MSEKTFRVILALVAVIWIVFVLLPSAADFAPRAWATVRQILPGDRPEVRVVVKDARSGDPVPDARVLIVTTDGTLSAATDETGQAIFQAVPAGPARQIRVQKLDYDLVTINSPSIAHRRLVRYNLVTNSNEGRRLYIGNEASGGGVAISALDVASRLTMSPPGSSAAWENFTLIDVKANYSLQRLYVLAADRLSVLSLTDGNLVRQVSLQSPAGGIAVSADSETVYVLAAGQGGRGRWLSAFSARTWTERYSVQISTAATRAIILPSSDGTRVYVIPAGEQNVNVFDSRLARRLAVYPIGDAVKDAALSSDGRTLYLLTERRQVPVAIDTTTASAAVPVLDRLADNSLAGATRLLLVDFEASRWLCLLQPAAQQVSIIDLNVKTLRSVAVGRDPAAIAAVSSYDNLYVANKGSNTVSIIGLSRSDGGVIDTIEVRSKPSLLIAPY